MSLLTAFPCARIELVSEPGITAGIEKLRAEALDIFQAGVAEADPARAVERALGAAGSLGTSVACFGAQKSWCSRVVVHR